jgi:polygalacturonase
VLKLKINFSRSLAGLIFFSLATWLAGAAPGDIIDVTKSGAVGDGVALNTVAIQKAIDDCSADGGGIIHFPPGRYVTGTIQLKNNVTLRLDAEAVLLGSTNAADYRNLDPFIDGVGSKMGYALIVAVDATHVGVEGAGLIDGQGKKLAATEKPYAIRPFLLRWVHCTDVTVKDVHLTNPGAWTLNFAQTKNITVEGVTIRSRVAGMANNDGIDLDSCADVNIRDCDIDSGDDALCLKTTSPLPCQNITASGCKLSTKCNAIKFGTESLGDFEHIQIHDCQLYNIGLSGIGLNSVDGAHLHDVTISDITIQGVATPISIRLGARLKTFRAGDQPRPPGILRDITIRNVRATDVRQFGIIINGIPDHPIEALTLENIQIEVPGGGNPADAKIQLPEKIAGYPEFNMFGKTLPASGIYVRHVEGVSFKNVQTTPAKPDGRPAVVFVDVKDATPADFADAPAGPK